MPRSDTGKLARKQSLALHPAPARLSHCVFLPNLGDPLVGPPQAACEDTARCW